MKQIKIIIERSKDFFWGHSPNGEGISGGGETVAACKQDVLDCIDTIKEFDEKNRPDWLDQPFELVYKFDVESLLEYYNGIFTNVAFERITGINQDQIRHYATGLKKPRIAQVKKIEAALHKLGAELVAVEL